MKQTSTEAEQFEKIPTRIFDSADAAARTLANRIAEIIREKAGKGEQAVLGLATGSTPVRLYQQLIRMHKEDGLSFKNVVTFNLDEYYGLNRDHPESYYRFMQEQLFSHIDIPQENVHVPPGNIERKDAFGACQEYEAAIKKFGGIDLQVLGIGRTGHIGFNEPGSTVDSRTRLVTLDSLTRRDAARDFLGEENVPRYAITMGVGTIMEAREIVLLAWGAGKAGVIQRAIEGPVIESLPASMLQGHAGITFYIDQAASSQLTRLRYPWLVGPVEWTPRLIRQSIVWLANHVNKPILKLVDAHYGENGMSSLVTELGPAYNLNIRIFNEIQHTITGWPGGKSNADDTYRPERAEPGKKRVLVLSPEPQDDVLGMGATLSRLVQQGHEVTVAYQTSGSLAVSDEEASNATNIILGAASLDPANAHTSSAFASQVKQELAAKGTEPSDSKSIRQLKGLIRKEEARASLKVCGIAEDQIRFMDLPFYENGRYRQFKPQSVDVQATVELLEAIKPHQIFVTGKLADPSSVPAITYNVFQQAWDSLQNAAWKQDCWVWLYRDVENPCEVHEIDMAVPCSPEELSKKIEAIYQHRSQHNQNPLSEGDVREIWQQAERNNRTMAHHYDALGLAEYEAIESFQKL